MRAFEAAKELVAPASFCHPARGGEQPPRYDGKTLQLGVQIIVEYIDWIDTNTVVAWVGIHPIDLTKPYWVANDQVGFELQLLRRNGEWVEQKRHVSWTY